MASSEKIAARTGKDLKTTFILASDYLKAFAEDGRAPKATVERPRTTPRRALRAAAGGYTDNAQSPRAELFEDRVTPGDWRVERENEDGAVEVRSLAA